ncbi:hypothetical protein [Massilia varians]|uniref:hypothetical protein n=1 Tax=Massilia varians TaxID=457921 RepID=UPI002490516F|nr:hypothetical protein [Massilia varians]
MSTKPLDKRKLRFANPQPLNLDSRVGQTTVNDGFIVGDWDRLFTGLERQLKRQRNSLAEKNRFLHADPQILKRCAELSLSTDQVQQLAVLDGCSISYLLGLDPHTLEPLRSQSWLLIAAKTCSISNRSMITPEVLFEVLSTGNVPQSASPSISHFINEAPLQVVVMTVEEAAQESGLNISAIWHYVAQIARAMSSTRLALVA